MRIEPVQADPHRCHAGVGGDDLRRRLYGVAERPLRKWRAELAVAVQPGGGLYHVGLHPQQMRERAVALRLGGLRQLRLA